MSTLTVKRCDRCGKEEDINSYDNVVKGIEIKEAHHPTHLDLCKECIALFKEWVGK